MKKIRLITVIKNWTVSFVNRMLKEKLPEQRKTGIIANLKRNWYFPISAMAFFCLNAIATIGYFAGMLIAFMAAVLVASQIPSLFASAKQNCRAAHVAAVMTAVGVCWGEQASFCTNWSAFFNAQDMEAMLSIPSDMIRFVSVFGTFAAVPFVYFLVLVFWKEITRIVYENRMFIDVNTTEWIVYGILIVVSLTLMITSFAQTEAFYGTEYAYDIIYTSDSPALVKGNVYLGLAHPENDLRQPLFAVFAAPFVGIPYLVGRLFGVPASFQAMLVNMVQIIMLFVANFMLTRMMKLNSMKRICFMLLTFCTYTNLLSTLMMEQYIAAYFWLIFCMYLISEKQRPDRIAIWAAGGTMLTSLILVPFMSEKNPISNIKEWFVDMVKYGLEFIAVMLVFCRFDVIFNLTSKISVLSDFTGRSMTMMDKVCQYTAFIRNCFIAPDAGVNTTAVAHISWQLNPVTSINLVGVVILLLVIISAVWNKGKRCSLLAGGWVAFSVVILLGVGWGTKENGLILYSLYFGWAFMVLLFQLIEKIENRFNIKFLTPVLSIGSAVALAVFNIPAIMEMVNFGITYFPA